MNRRNTYTRSINAKTGSQFSGSRLAHKSCPILIYLTVMVMCLGVLLFIVPDTANAEEVYGNIICSNCSTRILLIFKRGDHVIEKVRVVDGQYRVYLSPGKYNVEIISAGKKGRVTVESLTRKHRQDINIKLN